MLAAAAVGLAELSREGRFLMVNDEFCRVVGHPREALTNSDIEDVLIDEDVSRTREALAETIEQRERHVLEHRCVREDGSVHWIKSTLTRFDRGERSPSVLAVTVDVTVRKRAEEARDAEQRARLDSERRLQFALDAARMGTWWWDPHDDVAKHDARALEILGFEQSSEFSFERSLREHLSPDKADSYLQGLARIIDPDSREHQFRAEVQWTRPDGRVIWIEMTGEAHFDPGGERRHAGWLTGTILDITRRRRNEEAVAEASRQKDRFLATLAHELRNPLAPLCYAAEMLNEDTRHELEWSRGIIERQLKHLTRLIDDLLDLSRINRDRLDVRRERLAIADVVYAAVEATRPTLKQQGQELDVRMPQESIYVHGDFVRLTQVFTNLLKNSAKFSSAPGQVSVKVECLDGSVSICVRDSGVGIASDELSHVFDMFYQSESSMQRTHGGLGIGLYLVRRLVELHGGTVEARSAPPLPGSDFIVRLPTLPEQEAADKVPDQAPARAAASDGCRILIVDDNRDSADSLARLLRGAGHRVEVEYDGELAYAAAERHRPEVVLLDLGMPKVDGYEVCRRIRAAPWGESIRLVALTGWGRPEDRERTRSAGFDDHLVKPVAFSAVDAMLRRRRATD